MDDMFNIAVNILTANGSVATVSLLILFIVFMIWDRMRLIRDIDKKDQRIEKIVDDYHKGNITLIEALNSLRIVLAEIKGKL